MRHVLYVDDEPALCKAFERALRDPQLHVVTTTSPPEAVRLLEDDTFDVVASDYRMPGMDGLGVLRAARDRAPSASRILISGHADTTLPAMEDGAAEQVLTKPWALDDLRRAVRHAAERAALQRENRRLKELVEKREEQLTVVSLRALNLRDAGTFRHSRRVAAYARALGTKMKLGERALRAVERGAFLHDIGKLGTCDALLLKPGPLEAPEWTEMKRHPEYGAQFLEGIDFLDVEREVIFQHQECWNGRGYPSGLKGTQIRVESRVVAVVDCYDAIRCDRPYRKGAPHSAAISEIVRQSGNQFDPDVVGAFLEFSETFLGEIAALAEEI